MLIMIVQQECINIFKFIEKSPYLLVTFKNVSFLFSRTHYTRTSFAQKFINEWCNMTKTFET